MLSKGDGERHDRNQEIRQETKHLYKSQGKGYRCTYEDRPIEIEMHIPNDNDSSGKVEQNCN